MFVLLHLADYIFDVLLTYFQVCLLYMNNVYDWFVIYLLLIML